jgi:hypothetical protein
VPSEVERRREDFGSFHRLGRQDLIFATVKPC